MRVDEIIRAARGEASEKPPVREQRPPLDWKTVHTIEVGIVSVHIVGAFNGRFMFYRLRVGGTQGSMVNLRIKPGPGPDGVPVLDGHETIASDVSTATTRAIEWISVALARAHGERPRHTVPGHRNDKPGAQPMRKGKTERDRNKRKGKNE